MTPYEARRLQDVLHKDMVILAARHTYGTLIINVVHSGHSNHLVEYIEIIDIGSGDVLIRAYSEHEYRKLKDLSATIARNLVEEGIDPEGWARRYPCIALGLERQKRHSDIPVEYSAR